MSKDTKKVNTSTKNLRGIYDSIMSAGNGEISIDMENIPYNKSELRSISLLLEPEYKRDIAVENIVTSFLKDKGISIQEVRSCERTKFIRGLISYSEAKGIIKPISTREPVFNENEITPEMVERFFEDNKGAIIDGLREINKQDDNINNELEEEFKKLIDEMRGSISHYMEKTYTIKTRSYPEIENDFYAAGIGLEERRLSSEELWQSYRDNVKLLKWAIETKQRKYGGTVVKGISICEEILRHPQEGIKEVYDELFDLVLSNKEVAEIKQEIRISLESRYHDSFLNLALQNEEKRLTPEQKEFVINEVLSDRACMHYRGNYDLRYLILMNQSWTEEEKKQLVVDLWDNDTDYEVTIDTYENAIYGELHGYISDIGDMYELTPEKVTEAVGDPERASSIMDNINLCRMMTSVRPKYNDTLSAMKPTEYSSHLLKMYCRRIDEVEKEANINIGEVEFKGLYEEDPERILVALDSYEKKYDINVLKSIAEKIAPIYARSVLSQRAARMLLDENGLSYLEIPIDERQKMYGKIFFFANKIGLVNRLADYFPNIDRRTKVIDEELLKVMKKPSDITNNMTSKQRQFIKKLTPANSVEKYRRPWLNR